MKYYYGKIDIINHRYGFVEEGDSRIDAAFIELTEEAWQTLLNEQSLGKEIVSYEGDVFTADPGKYYVNESGDWQKRTDEEYLAYLSEEKESYTKSLTLTKRVFALALEEIGISYSELKSLIATNEQAQLEWDLCERLERSNPLLDLMAAQLSVTPEQLDYIFLRGNGQEADQLTQTTEESKQEREEKDDTPVDADSAADNDNPTGDFPEEIGEDIEDEDNTDSISD